MDVKYFLLGRPAQIDAGCDANSFVGRLPPTSSSFFVIAGAMMNTEEVVG